MNGSAIEVQQLSSEALGAAASGASPGAAFEARLASVQSSLANLQEITESAREIFICACQVYYAGKELDASVRRYQAEAAASVERLRTLAPLLEREITRISSRIDLVLDRATAIDPFDCSPEMLAHRGQLLSLAETQSAHVQNLLMRLMAV